MPSTVTASRTHTLVIQKAAASGFDARFVMSASSPDRVADTIDPAVYDGIAGSVDKLIALFNHDPDKIAGYWQKLKREKDSLTGLIKFASTNLGQMLKTLIDDGVPLGASIGFNGAGIPNKQGGIHFTEVDLLETSIVSIPAHPRAIQIAKSFGIPLSTVGDAPPATSSRIEAAIHEARAAIAKANLAARARK